MDIWECTESFFLRQSPFRIAVMYNISFVSLPSQVKTANAIASCGDELCPCPPLTNTATTTEGDGDDDNQTLPIYNVNNAALYSKVTFQLVTQNGFPKIFSH